MSPIPSSPPAPSAPRRLRFAARIGALRLSRPLTLLALWHRRARTRAQLARLDADALRDVGIGAAERRAECALWFWQGAPD